MKYKTIILSLTALGILTLGSAIAWDQFKTVRNDRDRIAAELERARGEVVKLKKTLGQKEAALENLIQKASAHLDSSAENRAAKDRLIESLKAKIEVLESRPVASMSASTLSSAPAAAGGYAAPAKVQIPRWLPEPPVVIERKIKERAARQHGTDYAAAKYEIEYQTEAYEKLLRYHRMNNVTVNEVLSKAAFEKGDDYRGVAWEVERQLEAAKVIQTR